MNFDFARFSDFTNSFQSLLKKSGAIVQYTFDVNSVRGGFVDGTNIKKEDLTDGLVVPLSHDYYSDGYYLVRKKGSNLSWSR